MRPRLVLLLLVLLAPVACVRLMHDDSWPCKNDGECPEGERCSRGECIGSDDCRDDSQCASGQVCDTAASRCRVLSCPGYARPGLHACPTYCAATEDCAPGFVCAPGRGCVLPECTPDSPESCRGYGCADGICQSSCSSAAQCAPGFYCHAGECAPPTCDAEDASACQGYACRNGACLESCRASIDCQPGRACIGVACTVVPGLSDSCAESTDCPGGGPCIEQRCSFVGAPCAGRTCGTFLGVDCGTCAEGISCLDNACSRRDNGAPCTVPEQCVGLECLDGVCKGTGANGAVCTAEFDCAVGNVCCPPLGSDPRQCRASGTCPRAVGRVCSPSTACADGFCNVSYCSRNCTSNADCGEGPGGHLNACVRSMGRSICWPGCASDPTCQIYDGFPYCKSVSTTSGGGERGVCSDTP